MPLSFVIYARQMARAVALHEEGTSEGHSSRLERLVWDLVGELRKVGTLPEGARLWPQAVLVHDFGKLFVPSQILRKPQALSVHERGLMQQHTLLGREELTRLASAFWGTDESARGFWTLAAQIAGGHHERPDGLGYPLGLKGDAVPPVLRVARTVDVFDALTARRAYREALPTKEAFLLMREEIGGFDEPLLEALQEALEVDLARVAGGR